MIKAQGDKRACCPAFSWRGKWRTNQMKVSKKETQLTASDRLPYEKFLQKGAESLSDAELLAIMLRTGPNPGPDAPQAFRDCPALALAEQVLSLPLGSRSGLLGLSSLSCNQLQQIRGIGEVKAVRICCIFELARRIALGQRKKLPAFPDPGTAADYCRPIFEEDGGMLERTILLLLDGKGCLIREKLLSIGTIDAALVSPREIFLQALRVGAVSFLLLHNHPSGDVTPSPDAWRDDAALPDRPYHCRRFGFFQFPAGRADLRKENNMVPNCAYGIDLGTSNIKIYSLSDDSVMMEKNMIAIENKKNIFAYGNSAYEMYEKAPANIQISHPLSNGVIADINNMERLIHLFISDMSKGNIRPADFYIAVPTDITEVEKRAFYDLIKDANVKARKIMVVEKAIADGLGMDIDVKNSQGVLVVDIGYDTTEVSILSLGGIVLSRLIKTGGLKFDEAVRQTVRREFNLLIGQKTAATIRQSIGDLEKEGKGAVVYGRDIVVGLPVEREIPTDLINSCLEEHFNTIIDSVKVILERTPPELGADIFKHGVYLTGGASQTSHFAELLQKSTGLKVNQAQRPLESVVLGMGRILKEDNYKSVAYAIEGMGK